MRALEKIILITSLLFVITMNFNIVHADGPGMLSNMERDMNIFDKTGEENSRNIKVENVVGPIRDLTQILVTIGAGVMVAVTTYMGIKYLTSGPETQAKLKIQLIGLVVAGVVIFGAYNIWKIVVTLASEL